MKKNNIGNIMNAICAILLIAMGVWFVVSCMQVSDQNIQPWNLIELIFGKL